MSTQKAVDVFEVIEQWPADKLVELFELLVAPPEQRDAAFRSLATRTKGRRKKQKARASATR
jgi:hypothetical protein